MEKHKIQSRIEELEFELKNLKMLVTSKNENLPIEKDSVERHDYTKCELSNFEIERYSRQMILPEVGVKGQQKVCNSSVLIVGTGGLGCPAALYLVSSGIGTVGLVDYDTVDISNLHRQVLHTEDKVGMNKVDSAILDLKRLNSSTKFIPHHISLNSSNALEVINKYNVATRYLLNDACVFAKKPLVSGSALRFEGQLIVYNYMNGPCYRCLYPTPPPPESVTNCSDGGVIGAVTGVIGSLQALEAIKIITSSSSSFCGKLLLYDGFAGSFRSIRLRGRQEKCVVCSDKPSITELQDYELFCGSKATDKGISLDVLEKNRRITVEEYRDLLHHNDNNHILVDTRPSIEYEICSLKPSINIPLADIQKNINTGPVIDAVQQNISVFVVCKRGNDSQTAVRYLLDALQKHGMDIHSKQLVVKDLIGGLNLWTHKIDETFPKY